MAEHQCLLRTPHEPHDWWHTTSGGGHMLHGPDPSERNVTGPHRCPGLTVLPYAGTSGHSGSDTSQERQERQDADGTTGKHQAEALALLRRYQTVGVIVHEVSGILALHHGQASSALTALERGGLAVRLAETRKGCHLYVPADAVDGREVYTPPPRVPRAVLEARLAAVAVLAQARCETYWSRPDEDNPTTCADDDARSPDAPYGAERYCWPCRIRHALGDSGR